MGKALARCAYIVQLLSRLSSLKMDIGTSWPANGICSTVKEIIPVARTAAAREVCVRVAHISAGGCSFLWSRGQAPPCCGAASSSIPQSFPTDTQHTYCPYAFEVSIRACEAPPLSRCLHKVPGRLLVDGLTRKTPLRAEPHVSQHAAATRARRIDVAIAQCRAARRGADL